MCQACYEKGFRDYPKYDGTVDHVEDYKRGYKTKQYESLEPDELQHTFFCDNCYQRGLSNSKNGLWAPPMSTKRGHYESYEKGYNQVEIIEDDKIPEYYLPESEKPEKQPAIKTGTFIKICAVLAFVAIIGYILYISMANQKQLPNSPVVSADSVSSQSDTSNSKPALLPEKVANSQSQDSNLKKVVAKPKIDKEKAVPPKKEQVQKVDKELPKEPKKQQEKIVKTEKTIKKQENLQSEISGMGKYQSASNKILTEQDLKGISKQDLKFMRNEIFARHGYIFKNPELNNYFSKQSWYKPKYSDVNSKLSEVEKQNVDIIKKHEH